MYFHISSRIKEILKKNGMSVSEFTAGFPCTREIAYKLRISAVYYKR